MDNKKARKSTKAERTRAVPDRTLFGSTLDSKALNKVLPAEASLETETKWTQRAHLRVNDPKGGPMGRQPEHPLRVDGHRKHGEDLQIDTSDLQQTHLKPPRSRVKPMIGPHIHGTVTDTGKTHRFQIEVINIKKQRAQSGLIPREKQLDHNRTEMEVHSASTVKLEGDLGSNYLGREEKSSTDATVKQQSEGSVVSHMHPDEQVTGALAASVPTVKTTSYSIPWVNMDQSDNPHEIYHSLGHCLRASIFPGAPIEWKSLVKDSYTKEVHLRFSRDTQHWHGRGTDDLGRWTERNLLHQKLKKAFDELKLKQKTGKG